MSTSPPSASPPAAGGFLERHFKIAERGSTVRTELIAGVVTFATMAYILFVNPSVLGALQDSAGVTLAFPALLTVTALAAAIGTIAMGIFGNVPFAIAAGLGLNAFVAFGLVGARGLTWPEAMGVIVRDAVSTEVKELDQEARGALRKHGVRFGQYTVFMPLLLKPAPTRLRLVLWSLWNGLEDFPESPPPGLVTIPNLDAVPRSHYTLAGYHPSGARALRIDMLERLADILRAKDSRAGFEATPDMLSITGMTLEQFNDLMSGLGYKGVRGERAKVKSGPVPVVVDPDAVVNPITEEESAFVHPEPDAAPEMEAFYSFTWAPKRAPRVERPAQNRRNDAAPEGAPVEGEKTDRPRGDRPKGDRPRGDKPRGDKPRGDKPFGDKLAGEITAGERPAGDRPRGDKPRGDKPYGDKPRGDKPFGDRPRGDKPYDDRGPRKDDNKPKTFEQRPPRVEKPIDPDNPFAALMALKNKM
jgi:ATP-dependent RNA helicase SUPV3L1/SUV3